MKASIFSIGTELLMGELVDTNSSWIASRLPALGIQLQSISIIGDNLDMLAEAFRNGLEKSDIVFTTGGLGPTQDDLTRESIAKALGETPTVQREVVEDLEKYFAGRGMSMPPHNIKQAHLIPSAQFIPNRNGTAPGWWVENNGKIIICMPGPPGETQPLWQELIEPKLKDIVDEEITITRNIKTLGMSEAAIDEEISELFGQENPYLGIYSKADGIHLRIIARAATEADASKLIQPMEDAIHQKLGIYIWGYDDETPEKSLGSVLIDRGLSLATMESVTGGFLANAISEVPESSKYFKSGIVAISPDSKLQNGIPKTVINKFGEASQETANSMATIARERNHADFGIGITGVSGPVEVEGKPPGQIYIALSSKRELREFQMRVPSRRLTIKRRGTNTAITELIKMIG